MHCAMTASECVVGLLWGANRGHREVTCVRFEQGCQLAELRAHKQGSTCVRDRVRVLNG